MERLILKRAKMFEWERQSQELRDILEVDRMKKYRASEQFFFLKKKQTNISQVGEKVEAPI